MVNFYYILISLREDITFEDMKYNTTLRLTTTFITYMIIMMIRKKYL